MIFQFFLFHSDLTSCWFCVSGLFHVSLWRFSSSFDFSSVYFHVVLVVLSVSSGSFLLFSSFSYFILTVLVLVVFPSSCSTCVLLSAPMCPIISAPLLCLFYVLHLFFCQTILACSLYFLFCPSACCFLAGVPCDTWTLSDFSCLPLNLWVWRIPNEYFLTVYSAVWTPFGPKPLLPHFPEISRQKGS